jgi:hypothetical protein
MNTAVARELLKNEIEQLRRQTYAGLAARIDHQECKDVPGRDGKNYHIDIDVFWDSGQHDGNLRVIASIDDGGIRAFVPMTDDFILAPNGHFVGE